jgi:hypothetical protein
MAVNITAVQVPPVPTVAFNLSTSTSVPLSTTPNFGAVGAGQHDVKGNKSTLNVFDHWLLGLPPVHASSIRALYPLILPMLLGLKRGEDTKKVGVNDVDQPLDEYDYVIGGSELLTLLINSPFLCKYNIQIFEYRCYEGRSLLTTLHCQ